MDADAQYNPTYECDARTIPEELLGKYDHVLASHVLEHFPWFDTIAVLTNWRGLLKPQGRLHVVVPSLEWVAEQILAEHPSKAVLPHLHAGITTPWDVHLASFTMRHLRASFENAGFAVVRARTGDYPIRVGADSEGQDIIEVAQQHYACGVDRERYLGISN